MMKNPLYWAVFVLVVVMFGIPYLLALFPLA